MVTFNWTCPVMVHVFFVFKDVAAIVGTTTQYCASKPKEKKKKLTLLVLGKIKPG